MATETRQEDLFANIAAQRAETQKTALIEPSPPARPSNHLPVQPFSKDCPEGFRPSEKISDAAGLRIALSELRERMMPFLQKLAPALPATRDVQRLDSFQWRTETDADRADFASVISGRGAWETVRIPHYGGPLGRAVTYYRTTFEVAPAMLERGAMFICCKGVDYKAHVFVNGAYLGSHEGFFAPFEFEFTAQACPGTNTLLVKVENDAICMGNDSWGDDGKEFEGDKIYAATGPGYDEPEVGWHHCPPGMGIYQELRIESRQRLFIHDLFVRPLPEENRAEAWVELWNCDPRRQPAKLSLAVHGQNFPATVCEDRDYPLPGPLGPRINYYRFNLELPQHRTWESDTPWLYQLQVKLLAPDGRLLDAASRDFGMRSFSMDTENEPRGRMYLNGKEIRLRGANTMGFEQQDVMKEDWNRLIDDILLAKLCNMNFLRLTQRPVQDEVYAYCDQLGMLTQTDLPLFGKMRRSQFAEGVRQAGEMERLIRSHPCNIMVSYANEPFPASWGLQLWRHLSRSELERFFLACDQTVRLENPDRVIKAVDGDYDPPGPGLPDNHCYCCWYNGHGVEIGRLHRGYWQRVKPGWMYGCGEFGAEGLDFADLMRRRYPAAWLPQTAAEERDWSPSRIKQAQTGRFHYMWFDTQHSVEDWSCASQNHQAWATRIMTEALRRDTRLNTCAIHLFIDAFPSGWMKAIMDVERRPKPAFFAYREALTPLMVNLRSDRLAYFAGETAELEAWICNDTQQQPAGACLAYRIELDGKPLAGGSAASSIPVCSSDSVGLLRFQLPAVHARTAAIVRLALLDSDGAVLHDTAVEFSVFPALKILPSDFRISVIGCDEGKAATLAREMGIKPSFTLPAKGDKRHSILIDDLSSFRSVEQQVTCLVREGSTAIFLELPEGKHELLASDIEVKNCGMGPLHFVSRATGHPLVAEFAPDDFKFWYDASVGHPSPLLERTFSGDGWSAILASGNGGWGGEWGPALAAAEKPLGCGRVRICNVKLAGRTANPVAKLFADRLLNL